MHTSNSANSHTLEKTGINCQDLIISALLTLLNVNNDEEWKCFPIGTYVKMVQIGCEDFKLYLFVPFYGISLEPFGTN